MIKSTEQLRGMRGNYATYEDLVMRCCDIADEIEQEIEERYVELPKDANGEPIHVGDVLQGKKVVGGWCELLGVYLMELDRDGWRVRDCSGHSHQPSLCRHNPPTVEDVLNELCTKAFHSREIDANVSYKDVIAEYAEKLQLREEQ